MERGEELPIHYEQRESSIFRSRTKITVNSAANPKQLRKPSVPFDDESNKLKGQTNNIYI